MRLPILEYPGYEADDVIGSLARQATEKKMDVFIITSDKDMMQLVNPRVRVLNPAKGDLIIDEKKVEEIMGVPPSKVADVMALMGDSIDNIPGARDPNEKPAPGERRKAGIGEVGARQLIQQFGSAEKAIASASEVKRSSYREALEKYAEFVTLSKKLATIPTDAPVPLALDAMRVQEADPGALRALYTELGFTQPSCARSLLSPTTSRRITAILILPAPCRKCSTPPRRNSETALWLSLDSEESGEQGFGTRVLGLEVSNAPGHARYMANDLENSDARRGGPEWLAG